MNQYIDIYSHEHEGFKILVKYQSWRTAVLNCGITTRTGTFSYVEKHRETDEVFVLLKGKAYLVIGEDGGRIDSSRPDSYQILPLESFKTYNVKCNIWHGVLMSEDASIYIVENIDTVKENGCYYYLTPEEKEKILEKVTF